MQLRFVAITAIAIVASSVQVEAAFQTSGAKWGPSQAFGTTGGTVTYSYMPTGLGIDGSGNSVHLDDFMPTGYKAEIDAAFAAWSNVADIKFVEVADSGTAFNAAGATGDIRIAGHVFDGVSGVLAHAYLPQVGAPSYAGDIHFDIAENWTVNGLDGSNSTIDIFWVALHEIGHSIGLLHDTNAGSVMSQFYNENISELQANDIAGAQFIYGPVPEPGAIALWGLGALGLVFAGRRRQKTTMTV